MQIEERFEVDSPIERLYDELNDVGGIGYCIEGVKEVQLVDSDHSRWKIEQRFGAISRTFDLQASIRTRQPPERIEFDANSHDVHLTGSVQLEKIAPQRTRCDITIDVDAVGPLVPLLEIFAKGPQRRLIQQTVANIRARLEGAPPAPLTAARPGLLARMRAWVTRLLHRRV